MKRTRIAEIKAQHQPILKRRTLGSSPLKMGGTYVGYEVTCSCGKMSATRVNEPKRVALEVHRSAHLSEEIEKVRTAEDPKVGPLKPAPVPDAEPAHPSRKYPKLWALTERRELHAPILARSNALAASEAMAVYVRMSECLARLSRSSDEYAELSAIHVAARNAVKTLTSHWPEDLL